MKNEILNFTRKTRVTLSTALRLGGRFSLNSQSIHVNNEFSSSKNDLLISNFQLLTFK